MAINDGGQMNIDESMLSEKDQLDFMQGFTDIDVVYEILLRQRDIPLSATVEKLDIGTRTYMFADAYVVCLDESITPALVEQLAAIEPTPIKFVLRDSAFDDNISLKDETIRRLEAYIARNSGEQKKAYTVEFI
jgi:adenine-specific DNA-methyltransferase